LLPEGRADWRRLSGLLDVLGGRVGGSAARVGVASPQVARTFFASFSISLTLFT